jgi:hypothetical protein
VAGTNRGFDSETFHGIQHHEAAHEGSELCVTRVLELVGIGIQEETTYIALSDIGGLVNQFPTVMVLPRTTHAWALRSLSGKQKREQPTSLSDASL